MCRKKILFGRQKFEKNSNCNCVIATAKYKKRNRDYDRK